MVSTAKPFTRSRILVPAWMVAMSVLLPVHGSGQDWSRVYCDECPAISQDALQQCRSGPNIGCAALAKLVREQCNSLCVNRPTPVACSARNVQHWNKVVFRIPRDRRIERDGTVAGMTNSVAEMIVKTQPNDMLDVFFAVRQIIELRPFAVIVLDEAGADKERRENLLPSDIEIMDVEYSTICAEERPTVEVRPPSPNDSSK